MKVLVDGQLIEYKKQGKGRVVLLLHGWGMSLGTFDALAEDLAKNFQVIRLDFPGHGSSPKPDDGWGVGEYTALTEKFLKKLKVDKVYAVVGHSFGGRVIIKGISGGLLKPEKVILMGAAGIRPKVTLQKRMFTVAAKIGKAVTTIPVLAPLRPFLQEKLYRAAGSTDYLYAAAMRPIFVNVVNEDLTPNISSITQPTLIVWGENDDQTPVDDAYAMEAAIEGSRLIVVPEVGHFVYNEAYPKVYEAIEGFLA